MKNKDYLTFLLYLSPQTPYTFKWQDGSLVSSSVWCSGHPKGGDNLCTFYTTTGN